MVNNNSWDVRNLGKNLCWCSAMAKPSWWHGPWGLHIAHIASGGARARRVDDRRAVILLNPLCHQLHVSDADSLPSMTIGGIEWPTIDERHTLWIKQAMDPEGYDPEFLQSIWIGKLPDPQRLPSFWETQFLINTGHCR